MISENIVFFSNNTRLVGTLYRPESNAPYPAMIAVHPATGGERTDRFYEHLKSELPRHGIAVLVFDRRGSGASEGNFATADFEDLADDVVAAVEYLQSRSDIDQTRIGLHGTSQGAWIAPIAAVRKPDIALVVAVSASGVSPADQMNYGVTFHLKQAGFDTVAVDKAIQLRNLVNEYFRGQVGRAAVATELSKFEHEAWFKQSYLSASSQLPVDITQSKWYYEMDYQPLAVWSEVRQPTLFLFAGVDEWVPTEQSMINYQQATLHLSDVTLTQIPGTDHLMCGPAGEPSQEYLQALINWLTNRFSITVGR